MAAPGIDTRNTTARGASTPAGFLSLHLDREAEQLFRGGFGASGIHARHVQHAFDGATFLGLQILRSDAGGNHITSRIARPLWRLAWEPPDQIGADDVPGWANASNRIDTLPGCLRAA
jgi:hypothetical protein